MSHPSRARMTRAAGAGVLAAALCFGTGGAAMATDGLPEPIAEGPKQPSLSIEEQLAAAGDSAIAGRWLVEVSGAAAINGGSANQIKRAQDGVLRAAASAGIDLDVTRTFSGTWNGFAVNATQGDAERLLSVPGVSGVFTDVEIVNPVQPGETPDINYARTLTGADVANEELGFTGEGVKVAIIDTGIDYNHPDLGGSGTPGNDADFPNDRVGYGYDFVGDAYDAGSDDPAATTPQPDEFPDDCQGHGTHVAGIVGADGDPEAGGVVGVAPDVTFGAYRVFGCAGSSSAEVIIAAMERAYDDGMDVINMSLGASMATWPSYPTAVVADRLVDAGVVVVVSQGNSADAGIFSGGAPAVAHNVISVGSIENIMMTAPYLESTGGLQPFYWSATGAPAIEPNSTYELVLADPLLACEEVQPATREGQALLVERGICSFNAKAAAGQEAGYDAVLIYNNTDGVINATVEPQVPTDPVITIPVVTLLQADGEALAAEIEANGGSTTITFADDVRSDDNPTGGYQSDFSSWGLAADLTLKPDVSAPGGNIYSTYPLEQGGYESASGTSMAAPHVAGAVALILEAHPDLDPYEVRTALTNTADPIIWGLLPELGLFEPVHRQGGGMIDIPHAITTSTTVEPQKISLGEGEAGPITTTISVTNSSDEEVTYTLGVEHGVATYGETDNPGFYILEADVEFSADTITVPAGGTATATVTIGEDFGVDGAIFGGWITLTAETETLRIPFAGLSGDYQALTAVELALLAYRGPAGELLVADPWHTYTMVDGDVPLLALYLAYPVSAMYLDVYQANEDGTKGEKVHSQFINYATLLDQGRLTGIATLAWDGTFQGNRGQGNDKMRRAADGDYVLELRVLKALGDPDNPDHWEIDTTVPFTIEYGEGADTSAGVGPEPGRGGGSGSDNPNKGPGNNNGKGPKQP